MVRTRIATSKVRDKYRQRIVNSRQGFAMTHRLLIGTDEAGYGPNLGPLVVTATGWRVPENVAAADLWTEFDRCITRVRCDGDSRLHVADSKQVYSPGSGLECLEVPVLSFLGTVTGRLPNTVRELGRLIAGETFDVEYPQEPWHDGSEASLPVESSPDHIAEWMSELSAAMNRLGIQLAAVRTRVVFASEFNRLADAAGSKGAIVSHSTLQLVRELCDLYPDAASVQVVCDKHGGRNRYDELIAGHFDDQFVFRVVESRERSTYRCGRAEFCFRTKAEELMPVALASMVSKYIRELLMKQFNQFWQRHVPGLKPTAGYPVDARRFRDEIGSAVESLAIAEDRLWRRR
jgi:hypothetical protein